MADGSVVIDIKGDDSDFSKKLEGISGKAKTTLSLIAKLAVGATAAVFGLAAAAINVGMQFEAGMSKVASISGATAKDMELLSEKAKEMGATTKFTATEAAEALSYMAMAGWKTEEMLSGIEGVMNLAAASGEDLATTSDIVTDALTAFGLVAADSGHFADVLATAASNANTNVSMMGQTFKYAAPIAGALGYSIEDIAVATGLMANAGVKAEQAGTSLRSMLTRLSSPPAEAAEALNALGVSATNADGTMRDLGDLLVDLRGKFGLLSESEKVSAAKSIAGTEAMSGLLAIVNASESDFNKLTTAVANADGAAEKMASTMQDNLSGQITILKSGLEGFGISIYEKFETPLKKAVKSAISDVSSLNFAMKSGSLSDSMDELAAGVGTLVGAVSSFATGVLPPVINGLAGIASHASEAVVVLGTLAAALAAIKITTEISGVVSIISSMLPGLKTAASGILAMDTAMKAVTTSSALSAAGFTAFETVVGVLTGRISLATAAQYAWNTAMAANPIGAVVTAVAALVGVIGLITVAMDKEESAVDKQAESISALTKEIKVQETAINDLSKARDESIKAAYSECDYVSQMVSELEGLVDANGKVKEGYEARAAVLANEINSVLPNSVALIEQEGEAYVRLSDKIRETIELKKAESTLSSMEESYTAAIKGQSDAIERLAKIKNELAKAEKNLADTQNEYNEAAASGSGLLNSKESELAKAKENVADLEKAYAKCQNQLVSYYDTIQTYEGLEAAILTDDKDAIQACLNEIAYGFGDLNVATQSELDALIENIDAKISALKELLGKGYDDAVQAAIDSLEAKKGDLLKSSESLGQDSAEAAADGIKSGSSSTKKAASKNADEAINVVNNKKSNAKKSGLAISQNLAEGISNGKGIVTGKTLSVANQVTSNLNSGKSKATASGLATSTGYAHGISSGGAKATSTAKTVSTNATNALKGLPKASHKIGSDTGEGIAVGLRAKLGRVTSAAADLVNKAVTAAMNAGIIRSPSRKMRDKVGAQLAAGIAVGMTEGIPKVTASATQVVDAVSERMTAGIKEVTDELTAIQERADKRAAEESLEQMQESIKSKNEEIAKAEKTEKEKLNRELLRLEEEYQDELKKKTLEAQQELYDEQKELIDDWKSEYEEALEEVADKQSALSEKILKYGKLYDSSGDSFELTNLAKQNALLEKYGNILDDLKSRGMSEGLLAEVANMDIDEAVEYGKKILAMNDDRFSEYISEWERQQQLASEIAQRFYADEIESVELKYTDKFREVLGKLPDDMQTIGKKSILSLIDGLLNSRQELAEAVSEISNTITDGLEDSVAAYVARIKNAYAVDSAESTAIMTSQANVNTQSQPIIISNQNPAQSEIDITCSFEGSLSALGKVLYPEIKAEEKRIGNMAWR